MSYTLTSFIVFMTLYSFYIGGRLKQAEERIDVLRAALDRHLQTGEDYRTAKLSDGALDPRVSP